jgi:hypothetical protein
LLWRQGCLGDCADPELFAVAAKFHLSKRGQAHNPFKVWMAAFRRGDNDTSAGESWEIKTQLVDSRLFSADISSPSSR